MIYQARLFLLASLGVCSAAFSALAFDPNEGAEPTTPSQPGYSAPSQRATLPASVVPRRYYGSSATFAPPPTAYLPAAVPAPVAADAPVYIANPAPTAAPARATIIRPPVAVAAPAVASAPVYVPVQAAQAAPVYNPAVAVQPVVVAPAPAPLAPPAYRAVPNEAVVDTRPANAIPGSPNAQMTMDAKRGRNRFSIGVDGFYDNYQEPKGVPSLEIVSLYGGVTASYEHHFGELTQNHYFAGTDLRVSRGEEDYKSVSGKARGIDGWEFDSRLLGGGVIKYGSNGTLKLYSGLGTRYYRFEGKGVITTRNAGAYDRRILQFYLPTGVTYEFPAYGLTFAPNIELNPLIYGYVESRVQNVPHTPNYLEGKNPQHSGGGFRTEFMVRDVNDRGMGWEAGPFFRFWDIDDSELDYSADLYEPANERWQFGAKAKFLF